MSLHSAVLLHALGEQPRLETVTIDDPAAGEVLVRMMASGICQTDVAALRDARAVPMVLGHEGSGIVEAVGAKVLTLVPGDHVVINWQAKCGSCRYCVSGRRQFCDSVLGTKGPRVFFAGAPVSVMLNAGTFCSHVVVPSQGAVRIRRDIPFVKAALLGCAVATGVGSALYCAGIKSGESVVVIGAGGVGLGAIQGARLSNASMIVAVDRDPDHLEVAMRLGATHCIDARDGDLAEAVVDLTDGVGVDHVLEVVGSATLMSLGLQMLNRGGTLTIVGAVGRTELMHFRPREFMSKQQRIQGCIFGEIQPERDLPMFADWYMDGRLSLDELHTSTVGLEQVAEIFSPGYVSAGIRTVIDLEM